MNTTPTDAPYRSPVPSRTFAYVRVSSDSQAENTSPDVQAERVGAKQVVTAKGTPGDHHGVAREHEAGLSHARWTRTKRARVPESDFNALRGLPWRIPSSAAADANQGGVVHTLPRPLPCKSLNSTVFSIASTTSGD
jgi:hypothetical protein